MADTPPSLTPAQQAQIAEFRRRHPNVPSNPIALHQWMAKDKEGLKDWVQLNQSLGLGGDYVIDPSSGAIHQNANLGKFLLEGAAIVGGTLAGGYGLAALAGGAAPAAAGTTFAGDLAGTGSGIATSAAAAAPSTFGKFVTVLGGAPALVGTGLNFLGAYMQNRAAGEATDKELAAGRDALGVQTQMYNTNTGLNVAQANQNTQAYNTTLANLAPYRGIGAAAASKGGWYLGLPGYEQGDRTVVNAPPPSLPVQPLSVPPPINVPGQPQGQATPNAAFIPTNQRTNGLPQVSSGNTWQPPTAQRQPQVGEQRMINGQLAAWDGRGWKAAQQQAGA